MRFGSEAWNRRLTAPTRGRVPSGSDRMASGRDRVVSSRDRVVSGRDRVVSGRGRMASGRDRMASGRGRMASGCGRVASGRGRMASGRDRMASGRDRVASGRDRMVSGNGLVRAGRGRAGYFLIFGVSGAGRVLGQAETAGAKPGRVIFLFSCIHLGRELILSHLGRIGKLGLRLVFPRIIHLGLPRV